MKLKKNKKGTELTLQTIIVFIIITITFIVMVYFIITKYGGGADKLDSIGKGAIEQVSKSG